MKKIYNFLCVTFILFSVFACTMPSELEIIGSPSLKFAANMNFGNYFNNMADEIINSDSTLKPLACTNPALKIMTFIIRMEIFNKENYKCEVDLGSFNNGIGSITIDKGAGAPVDIPVELVDNSTGRKLFVLKNEEIIAESDDPYIMTFKGIDEYLEDFEFTRIQSKIYISGSELANAVSIDLHEVKPDGTEILIVPDGQIIKGPSGIKDIEEYEGIGLPEGGAEIDLSDTINSGGQFAIKYKIFLPEDTEIDLDWLNEPQSIVAEIIIWLPMTFESIDDNAIIKFPDFFDGVNDALKSFAEIGFIKNMNMNIAIDPLNPFGNGSLIMSDNTYGDINCPLDDYHFYFKFTSEDLDYINNNVFKPRFYILYPNKNSLLEIPNGDIMITTITLNAWIKHNMEL